MLFGHRFYRKSVLFVYLILIVACFNQSDETEAAVTATPIASTSLPAKITGEKPEPRLAPGMAYDSTRKVIVLYGGSKAKEPFNDTWLYNGTQWELLEAGHPTSDSYPSMAYDEHRQKMVLFNWHTEEMWEYDGESWEQVNLSIRLPVNVPVITYDPIQKRVIIFGEIGDGKANETWAYDGENLELLDSSSHYDWAGQTLSVNRVLFPALVIDEKNQEMILQPPYGWTFVFSNNTWEVKLNEKQSLLPDCVYCIWPKMVYDTNRELIVMFDGEHTWELVEGNWIRIETLSSPPPRTGHAMAYDEARGVVVLFGGADKNKEYLNDLWEYDGITWVQR
jgi:hypothetical protein